MVHINSKNENTPFSKNKLLQITGNLISNALKFTPKNGQVTVNLDLELGERDRANMLHLTVKDSGIGLDADAIDAILKGSAESTDGTNKEKGYGFGLAMVKHLIDNLKGSFDIHSRPGEGAAFEVILPQRS